MKWFCIGIVVFVSACSQRGYYDSIQTGQRNECERLAAAQRDECFKHLGPDYQTYERQRQELLEDKNK